VSDIHDEMIAWRRHLKDCRESVSYKETRKVRSDSNE